MVADVASLGEIGPIGNAARIKSERRCSENDSRNQGDGECSKPGK